MNVYSFQNTNHKVRDAWFTNNEMEITDEEWEMQMDESEKSGLIPDFEHNIYVREGYGALVGICPDNCSTLEQLFNYTRYDRIRKVAGKPTLLEYLLEIRVRIKYRELFRNFDGDYFGYKEIFEKEGMDLIIGPGGCFEGEYSKKAVYCQNYKKLLRIPEETNIRSK